MTVKISNLPAATSVGSGDVIPVVQSGTTKKVDLNANWSINITGGNITADALTSGTVPSARIDGNYTGIDQIAAVVSHPTDTGSVSTTNLRTIISTITCLASGAASAVIAARGSSATATRSAVVASRGVQNNVEESLALGDYLTDTPSTANRKIHLFGTNGNVSIAGTLTQSATFTDFAEMMPNGTGAEIEAGTLLTLDGGEVKPANDGDEICGVVSHTAAILAGDTPFCWQGRYMHDEFGRRLYEEIPDPDWEAEIPDPDWDGEGEQPIIPNPEPQPIITVLKENPDWDPSKPQVSRSERPDEWTPVGLIGQVYVRTGEQVQAGDRIKAQNGMGFKSTERTGVKVMTVTKDFDGKYGIARCFLNVMA